MIEVDRGFPVMSPDSAVAPTVRETGDALILAYRLPLPDSGEDACAVVRFGGVRDWHYGYPNDEGLDSHPLYGMGLSFYEFHVTPVAHHGERAWVATFHDGTLTVFANSLDVISPKFHGDPASAIRALFGDGPARDLDGG